MAAHCAWLRAGLLGMALMLGACAGRERPSRIPPPASPAASPTPTPAPAGAPATNPANAVEAGVRTGPAIGTLGLTGDSAARALAAFRRSCPALLKRADVSGLTRREDWRPACRDASTRLDVDGPAFFAQWFEAAEIGSGTSFATGYYEPEIAGSRVRLPGYEVPVYRRPPDLVDRTALPTPDHPTGRKIRGRMQDGALVPFYDRAEIDRGALAGQGLEIAWAHDPVEMFFLQIQGSGRLLLPDGQVMRIGYDGQNGRDYVGIGRLMRDRKLVGPDQLSMQGMMAWLRANPDQGRALMEENRSFIFFKELVGAGPLGSLGVPVTGRGSVAADPRFVPLGAPVMLAMDRPEASGLWVAQDIGGAIKGANRFDTFWGAGEEARLIAGGMSAHGRALLLLPKGTVARITGVAMRPEGGEAGGDDGGPAPQR